jgi:hypothetical protein
MFKIEIILKSYSTLTAAETSGIKHLINFNGLADLFELVNTRGCNIIMYKRASSNNIQTLYGFLIITKDKEIRFVFVKTDSRERYIGTTLINTAKSILEAGQALSVKHDHIKDEHGIYDAGLMSFLAKNKFIANNGTSTFKRT